VDADNQGVSPGKRGHTNVKRKFRARAVGITTLGVDGIVAEKGTDPLTALGRARPLVLRNATRQDTNELIDK